MKNSKSKVLKIVLFFSMILIVLIYLLILNFGYINHHDSLTPTGNVDIFDINCDCPKSEQKDDNKNINEDKTDNSSNTSDSKSAFEESNDKSTDIDKNKPNEAKTEEKKDLMVSDNYTVWGEKPLRIFSNQAYEYTSKIAPNSSNSYVFVIRNNNDFDIAVDMTMVEENPYNINMKYKLRSKGVYLTGNEEEYEGTSKLEQRNITIKAKESISYTLDWKWLDSDNDTYIGEGIDANYKLSINIGANSK